MVRKKYTIYSISLALLSIVRARKFCIGKNLDPVLFQFASPIDTLENQLSKTLLIKSSNFTKTSTSPSIIELTEAINEIKPNEFKNDIKRFWLLDRRKTKSLFKSKY